MTPLTFAIVANQPAQPTEGQIAIGMMLTGLDQADRLPRLHQVKRGRYPDCMRDRLGCNFA
jgi:hypothetical protein